MNAAKKIPANKLRKKAKDYPIQSVASSTGASRGVFEELIQIYCLGIERTKMDNVIDLLELTKE